jgi:X-X-X-Leu-X-X-Gly heptad repeat protein
MPETNGHQDNPSRLDRMEKMVEHIISGHIVLEDKLSRLTDKHGQIDDQLLKLSDKVDKLSDNVGKLSDKVDKLSDTVSILHKTVVLQASTMDRVITNLAYTGDKLAATDARLDRLVALVETDHRNFNERLVRLESRQ